MGTEEDTTGRNSPGKDSQLPSNYSRRSLPSKKLTIALLRTCSLKTVDTTGESSTEILQKVLLMTGTSRIGSGQRQEEQPEAEEEVLLAGLQGKRKDPGQTSPPNGKPRSKVRPSPLPTTAGGART